MTKEEALDIISQGENVTIEFNFLSTRIAVQG